MLNSNIPNLNDDSGSRPPSPTGGIKARTRANPLMAVSLSRKLERLLLWVGVPLVLMLGITVWTGVRLAQSFQGREVERIYFLHLNNLQTALLNVETGIRGYALSSNTSYLEPYTQGNKDVNLALAQLGTDINFKTEVKPLEAEVRTFVQDWAVRSIEVIKQGGFDRSGQLAVISEGKTLLDILRVRLKNIFAGSEQRRTALRLENGQFTQLVVVLPLVVLVLVLIGFFLLRLGLLRFVLEPVEHLRVATASLAAGEVAVRVHIQSDDELGELARTLNRSAEILKERNVDLLRSNRELEQFAYVASHDLQEPLRMVSSYTQLLKKRYAGQLDAKADQYIEFAVDGANRMQRLIQDLLAFSRVGTHPLELTDTDLNTVLAEVVQNLKLALEDSGGEVVVQNLPQVCADRGQVSRVLQNLVGNGLKFQREGVAPVVQISARAAGSMWEISVKDNGIGIEPGYFERIFIIFQRLHTKEQYSGSGIGLAVVKKIIERHGGKLWVESSSGEGSTFHFTLPAVVSSEL